ncbi:MAG: carbohydrate kinase [Balneolaceae bacterium]
MNQATIIGIGELLWDHFPDGRRPGGAPANVIYHTVCLGNRGILISRVGDDSDGRELTDYLRGKGIDTDTVQVDRDKPTGWVTVDISTEGDPSYTIASPVAWDYIRFEERLEGLAVETDAVVFGTLAQRSEVSAETIRQFLRQSGEHVLKVLDLNLRPGTDSEELIRTSLMMADILKVNLEEWDLLTQMLGVTSPETILMEKFRISGICLTLGRNGSRWIDADRQIEQAAYPSDSSTGDAVGLGDAFTAVLTSELVKRMDPVDAMRNASRYAAIIAGKKGGMPAISASERNLLE